MEHVPIRIPPAMLQRLQDVAESHSVPALELTVSEAVRRIMRQWRACKFPRDATNARAKVEGRETVVTSMALDKWMADMPNGEIIAIVEWGLDRPCNQPAPRLDIGGAE
jgi:hypothetical protein